MKYETKISIFIATILLALVAVMFFSLKNIVNTQENNTIFKLEKEIRIRELYKRLNDLPPVPNEAR